MAQSCESLVRLLFATRRQGAVTFFVSGSCAIACVLLACLAGEGPIGHLLLIAFAAFALLAYLGAWRGMGLNESGDHLS
jgi:hypothetical protein